MTFCTDSPTRQQLLAWVPAPVPDTTMEIDSFPLATPSPPRHTNVEPVPEVEVYLRLLINHLLLNDQSTYPKAMQIALETIQKMQSLNRRSMDPIAAKVWYAVERTYELAGDLAEARP